MADEKARITPYTDGSQTRYFLTCPKCGSAEEVPAGTARCPGCGNPTAGVSVFDGETK